MNDVGQTRLPGNSPDDTDDTPTRQQITAWRMTVPRRMHVRSCTACGQPFKTPEWPDWPRCGDCEPRNWEDPVVDLWPYASVDIDRSPKPAAAGRYPDGCIWCGGSGPISARYECDECGRTDRMPAETNRSPWHRPRGPAELLGKWDALKDREGISKAIGDYYEPPMRKTPSWIIRGRTERARYPWQTRSAQLPTVNGASAYNRRLDPRRIHPEDDDHGVFLRCLVCLRENPDNFRQDQVCRFCERAWQRSGKPWDDRYDAFLRRRRGKLALSLGEVDKTLPNARKVPVVGGQSACDQGLSTTMKYNGSVGESQPNLYLPEAVMTKDRETDGLPPRRSRRDHNRSADRAHREDRSPVAGQWTARLLPPRTPLHPDTPRLLRGVPSPSPDHLTQGPGGARRLNERHTR